ncbi:LysR family transcriptional regulator [Novosphingobium flavum]|uniref:LysR family transcriptional regulator n=1 Tax=Novosphingobium flavum TaxID=1778672 RepID=A0A7X1FW36_9SPHN|nr:LysR family transcriptional regulator [Novosphingobium flavum]MBC2667457.1 LysR family transcriptional regulator [Novosphingobium flavum]
MARNELGDLAAFAAVAEERSFTRAAARLRTSQSAISQTVKRLEAQLGIKLLSRTTRNVGVTEAGEQLLEALRPALGEIEARLVSLSRFRDRPAGTVRITCSRHAAETILWPAVDRILADYPDIQIELSLDSALTNIVADRFDAGVRLGERVERDMIAVRIGPDLRLVVVGAPEYFARRGTPDTPRDLTDHACINLRMATKGEIYAWEFEKDGVPLNVRVDGPLVVNDSSVALSAALAGHGLAFVMEDQVRKHIAEGRLVCALEDWCPAFPGHHLYYPSRRELPPAFAVVVEALRFRS